MDEILENERIFKNLEGEIIKECFGDSVVCRIFDSRDLEMPYLKINTIEAIEKLRDYLTEAIKTIKKYSEVKK